MANDSYQLKLINVSCASRVKTIEDTLAKMPDIRASQVNFAERTVIISGNMTPEIVIDALRAAGIEASLAQTEDDTADQQHVIKLIYKTITAGVLGVLVLALGLSPWQPSLATSQGQMLWFLIGLITAFGIWYAGWHLYKSAFNAFINHHATMDTLITVGTGAAWLYSMIITLMPQIVPANARHVYFEAALIIIAFVNLGAALELSARGKTSQAIKRLIGLQAKTARRIDQQGNEQDVPIESLQAGDLIRVRPGEKVAVDGCITEGSSTINESMLTGESMPVTKHIDDTVFGGTMNTTGSFIFRATQVGKDTALAQIIQLVQSAQGSKPPIAKLADVTASYFVPTVLILSIITALIWINLGFSAGFVLVASMTVLVIACPCALGLAAPISVIVGMGKSAENGILIRNGNALQKASQLRVIVLDKTGTITKGQPEVVHIITQDNGNEDDMLRLAASIEQGSEHPLANAIINKAQQRHLPLEQAHHFTAISGEGVSATINDQLTLLGNAKLMTNNNINITALEQQADQFAEQGETPMYLAVANQLVGIISVTDPIQPHAHKAIQQLQAMGLDVVMITGDNQKTADAIANQVGISTVFAEAFPKDKADHIKQLQQNHQVVAMVGDGINDAPALTQADVGFAIGAGTDVAIESADITLISNSIQGVINAITISQATMRNIKQNLVGAFVYNCIGIPIAAGILYPFIGVLLNPMIAGAAMAASSLTVVTNANRLRLISIKEAR